MMSRRRPLISANDSSSDDSDVEEVSPPKIQKQNSASSSSSSSAASSSVTSSSATSTSAASSSKLSLRDRFSTSRRKGFANLSGLDDDDDSSKKNVSKDSSPKTSIKTEVDGNDISRSGESRNNEDDIRDDDGEEQEEEKKAEIKTQLSDAQRAKIERNRQKALLLKQARLAKMPTVPTEGEGGFWGAKKNEKMTRVVDSGGGFLIEEEIGGDEGEEEPKETVTKQPGAILQDPFPDTDSSKLPCEECEKPFSDSYLFNHFDCNVCDACRDNGEKHRLITKTDAKNEYLLKDEDFFIREPALKYILKKNPHNSRWGDMKLFLHCQVHARAMKIYGTEDALEEKHDERDEARQKIRQKKFDKKVKELRRKVRSSLYTKKLGGHEHEFGEEEEYDSDKDEYSKKCKTCSHVITYEKM